MTKHYNRRTFIEFLGKGTLGMMVLPGFIYGCSEDEIKDKPSPKLKKKFNLVPVVPTEIDDLVLMQGLSYDILVRWGDAISNKDRFGFNNDFIQFLEQDKPDEALLWVNHEYIKRLFVTGDVAPENITKAQIENEMYEVGGSIIKIKQTNGTWQLIENAQNKRINGLTNIPFNWDEPIAGATSGMGTLGNCSGGLTPWGNILTCEENYDGFYGETGYDEDGTPIHLESSLKWEQHFPENKPEHYGWVVEVNPNTGEAQKHIALGRFMHECAKVHELADKRLVVYSGDDANDRCFYKFVGSQTEVLVRARESSLLVGGSMLARPEDIEIDPITGDILVALTNNTPKGNYYGSILKLSENDGYDGLTFESDTHLAGGEAMGFACPDNMAFDQRGNLWFTSDMSGSVMNKPPYEAFKNNGLFFVPRTGDRAGEIIQVASAPIHAEFTGPCFSPDGKTLFLSVQHPGEYSPSLEELSSHWPDGGNELPKSSVVCIQGEALQAIMDERFI